MLREGILRAMRSTLAENKGKGGGWQTEPCSSRGEGHAHECTLGMGRVPADFSVVPLESELNSRDSPRPNGFDFLPMPFRPPRMMGLVVCGRMRPIRRRGTSSEEDEVSEDPDEVEPSEEEYEPESELPDDDEDEEELSDESEEDSSSPFPTFTSSPSSSREDVATVASSCEEGR